MEAKDKADDEPNDSSSAKCTEFFVFYRVSEEHQETGKMKEA